MNNGITVKAIIIGMICLILGCGITTFCDMRYRVLMKAYFFIPSAIMFLILVITILKWVLSAIRVKLTSKEAMVIYIIMIVSMGLSGTSILSYFFPAVSAPYYYGTAENRWEEVIVKHIPKWLIPSDPNPATSNNEAIQYFYEGLPKDCSIPWFSWLSPDIARKNGEFLLTCYNAGNYNHKK